MSGKVAVVVGGGPVGAVTAMMLAKQGWKVQVFERAGLPNARPSQHDQRAYRLSLTARALRVLKVANVNMSPIVATQGKFYEAAIYKTDGQVSVSARVPVTKDPLCVRAFRDEIALLCINEAQHQHPHAIHFKFNAPITSVDLDKQTVHAATEDSNATKEVPYDLLVGADGVGSVVRSALQQIMPPHYLCRYTHNQVYSMMQVTPADPAQIPPHVLFHAYAAKEGVVLWDVRGSDDCRVGLTLPQEHADALRQGDTDKVVQMLEGSAPTMPDCARKAVMELVHSRPEFYPMPSWTHLSQLHGPKTVLLGDAAHTMTPALGQGLNLGLEDAAVFAQCLERHQGDVDATLPAYNKLRLPDVQAIMIINEVVASSDIGLTIQERDIAHGLWVLAHRRLLNLHMVSRTMLHKVVPRMFGGPSLIQVVMSTSPYSNFLSTIYKDGVIFAGFVIAVTSVALHWI